MGAGTLGVNEVGALIGGDQGWMVGTQPPRPGQELRPGPAGVGLASQDPDLRLGPPLGSTQPPRGCA